RQSEIAIAVLVACARRPDAIVPTALAAAEAGASRVHTSKVIYLLTHAGLLTAVRGRAGGLRLARPADTISLAQVLQHSQPESMERPRHGRPGSALDRRMHTILGAAQQTFALLLGRFSIADLVTGRTNQPLACSDCRLLNPAVRPLPADST